MVRRLTTTYVSDKSLFNAAFHHASSSDAVLTIEVAADNRRTYNPRGVDDFLDSRDTLCDTHAGHTSEMKGFQGHLRSGFAN